MGSQRLYYDDPLALTFEAEVIWAESRGEQTAVELDRSAFYPESGGQMADRGRLGDAEVIDVQLDGERVIHTLQGTLTAGERVRGEVDRKRRRSHMALHTGQHILSRALLDIGSHDTRSSRLGENQCTIDVDSESVNEGDLARAEALANAVVDDDVQVLARFPDEAELAELLPRLRKAADGHDRIRLVSVGDFDVTPCGGTHCTRSAQVGLVTITGVERHKRRARITFVSGPRARAVFADDHRILHELARSFSCGADQLGTAIDKLRAERDRARREAKELGGVAAALFAEELLERGVDGPISLAIDGPAAVVREVAKRVTDTRPESTLVLAARSDEALSVVIARGADATSFDCGAVMKRLAAAAGGKGGGRPDKAEGRLPPDADWERCVREALS